MGLKELIDKRNDILFAEIGALIHDLGKLSKEFVEGKDDYAESDSDTSKKFRHEKVWINNEVLLEHPSDEFCKRVLELILKKESIKRLNDIMGKLNSIRMCEISARDLPGWAKNDNKLKNLGKIKKSDLLNFINSLSKNALILKYSYVKSDFFSLSESLIKITKDISINFDNSFPLILLPVIHHRNDKKFFGFDKGNLPNQVKLLLAPFGADGIDSAIDKMVSENCSYVKQSRDHAFIANAFGYEGQKIDLNLPDSDNESLSRIKEKYANELAVILDELKNNASDVSKWINKRLELLSKTRDAFLNALGETRRPANDVTLWDHSYSVASLYKAALAEVVINGWKEPQNIKWRLLAIRFNGDEFYSRVPKIGDVLGRKELIKKMLDAIRGLLEVVVPIGNEIYRDEHGSVFLVPECVNEDKVLEISEDVWNEIKRIQFKSELNFKGEWERRSLVNIFNHQKPASMKQLIEHLCSFISEGLLMPEIEVFGTSRGALNLNDAIKSKPDPKPDIERLKTKWADKTEGYEKCSACGLRPIPLTKEKYKKLKEKDWNDLNGEEKNSVKAYERKVCIDCLKLMQNRVEGWADNENWSKENSEKPSRDTSIWLDEVVDGNNRLALVYIGFDLSKWLNGEMLNTFLSKPLLDETFKKEFVELENITDYNQLVDLIKEAFDKDDFNYQYSVTKRDGNNLTVGDLFKVLGTGAFQNKPSEVFKAIVEEREPDWINKYPCPSCAVQGDNEHKAVVFLLHLTRKHPSFARLRRIWETTRNFGIEIFYTVKNNMLEKRSRTIITFTPQSSSQSPKIAKTHTYWFKDNKGRRCELVVLPEGNSSQVKVAIINAPSDLNLTRGNSLELYDEDFVISYGSITIQNIAEEEFIPVIPYLFDPSKTLFFVPLKRVWEIITFIRKEYEIQFSKVQNRLPMRLGFVAFHKRTPMYVVLDATEKICSGEVKPEELEASDISEMNSRKIKLKLSDGYEYYFSYSTGDPNKEDLFHPYFIIENNNGWKVYTEGSWKTIKHVKYLNKGDKVSFYPPYFDFIWLDTNVRRLDAGSSKKERKHWLFKKASPKPYKLKAIDDFERLKELLIDKLHLTSSQLLNAYGFLISKLQEWGLDNSQLPINDKTFEELVENVILNIPFKLKIKYEAGKGTIEREDFEFLKKTMLNGIFFDFIDMWHTVLKKEFKKEDKGNE